MDIDAHWILVSICLKKQWLTVMLAPWGHLIKQFTIYWQVWRKFNHSFLVHLKKTPTNYSIITCTAIVQSKRLFECH